MNYQLAWFTFSDDAKHPVKGTKYSAGYDLFSTQTVTIPPKHRVLIKTDIGVILPRETYGRIAPRSGLAYKHGLDVFGGVIDSDYRGNIGVILFNSDSDEYTVNKGDKIAQLIIEKCFNNLEEKCLTLEEAEYETEWFTPRGEGGFGSTGK